jgi:hypothetical protein
VKKKKVLLSCFNGRSSLNPFPLLPRYEGKKRKRRKVIMIYKKEKGRD